MPTFPFGRPVLPCRPLVDGQRNVFVLGAYPSALHVAWTPPSASGARSIRALAVDNEPEPFWDGSDEADQIKVWKDAVDWLPSWGEVAPVEQLNGSSGTWLADKVLEPLGT